MLFTIPAATGETIARRAAGASVRGFAQVPMRQRELRGRPAGRGLRREQLNRACTIVPVFLYTGTGHSSDPRAIAS